MKAKAVVFRAAYQPTIETIEVPEPEVSDVVVNVEYSGVSIGTETSIIDGTRTHNGTFPLVSGYMASGIVERVGSGVTSIREGDRVAGFGTRIKGDISPVWGGHCSKHVCEASVLEPLPHGCDLKSAAMWIPPAVGLNAVRMANITESDIVLISGQGLIGQFFCQWARARGAMVIAIEPDPRRRELTKQYVRCPVLDPRGCDLESEIERLTGGEWPTVVVEATANPRLITQTTSFVRRMHARVVFLSWYPGKIELEFAHFHNWEATTFFPMGAGGEPARRAVLDGFAGGFIQLGENLSHQIPWEEAVPAFEGIRSGDRSVTGMVIDWKGAGES